MKAFKYPLYPTDEQEQLFIRMTGACRWVWNYCVKINEIYYASTKKFLFEDELKKHLPFLKKLYPWLKEVPAHALQNKIKDYDKALRLFLKYRDKVGFPSYCYKKEDDYGSFRINQVNQKHIKLNKKDIIIPKVDDPVSYTKYRRLEGRLLNITIKYEHFKWWVVCCCDDGNYNILTQVDESDIVGIDLGLKTFAVLSDETEIKTNKFLHKKEKKLKREQRRLARKQRDSKNRLKNRKELNKIHRKVADQRSDFLHKTSDAITKQYKVIGVEDLNIRGMIKNHKLAKAIQNQGWGMFIKVLEMVE
jgi:putative transposase